MIGPATRPDWLQVFIAMNPFDILLAVIAVYCLVRGIFRGLVKEISSIIGVIGGFYAGYTFYPTLAGTIGKIFSNPAYARLVAFLLIFIGVYLAISICGVIIKYFMNIVYLGWIDRIGGALFGLAKAVLIAAVLVIAFTAFLPRNTPLIKESLLARPTMVISETMAKITSTNLKRTFMSKARTVKQKWAVQK